MSINLNNSSSGLLHIWQPKAVLPTLYIWFFKVYIVPYLGLLLSSVSIFSILLHQSVLHCIRRLIRNQVFRFISPTYRQKKDFPCGKSRTSWGGQRGPSCLHGLCAVCLHGYYTAAGFFGGLEPSTT